MARTLSEILQDADKSTNIQELITLWNEIANKKKQYALVELYNAKEHISELALKCEGSDFDKGNFYWFLRGGNKQQELILENKNGR